MTSYDVRRSAGFLEEENGVAPVSKVAVTQPNDHKSTALV